MNGSTTNGKKGGVPWNKGMNSKEGKHQSRGTHPTRGRVHLGWFDTKEEAKKRTAEYADEVCQDRSKCGHPAHVEARRVEV